MALAGIKSRGGGVGEKASKQASSNLIRRDEKLGEETFR